MKRTRLPIDTSLLALIHSVFREKQQSFTSSFTEGSQNMVSQAMVRKEVWREASNQSMLLLRHVESLCVLLRHSAKNDNELLKFTKKLLHEQEPFNQHLHTIQEKDRKGIIIYQDWNKVITMTVNIAAQLMTIQDTIDKNSPEGTLLEKAGQHLEEFSKLVEQLRGSLNDRLTLDTSA